MKKALQVNINDKIFFINDDAYNLLQNYLDQLTLSFPGNDGAEIVADIETRIGEILENLVANGHNVIDIACVNRLIETVGRPEDIGNDTDYFATNNEPIEEGKKKLYRDPDDKVFGGVLSGVAHYFNWNVSILRIIVILISVFTALIPATICYLIAWMVIPEANTPQRQLEMNGEKITFDSIMQNIRKTFSKESIPDINGSKITDLISTIFKIGAKVIFGAIIAFASLTGGASVIFLMLSIFVFSGSLIMGCAEFASMMFPTSGINSDHQIALCLWGILLSIVTLLPSIAAMWGAGILGYNWRKPSKALVITGVVILMISIAAFIICYGYLESHNVYI